MSDKPDRLAEIKQTVADSMDIRYHDFGVYDGTSTDAEPDIDWLIEEVERLRKRHDIDQHELEKSDRKGYEWFQAQEPLRAEVIRVKAIANAWEVACHDYRAQTKHDTPVPSTYHAAVELAKTP